MDKKFNQETFGARADDYINSPTHAKGASLWRVVDLANAQPDWFALDIATGAGHTALAIAPRVRWVLAADITGQMLALTKAAAMEKGLANVMVGFADAERLPYQDQTFDLVTCRIAAHHFPEIPAFLAESRRVLRFGGTLALVDNVVPAGTPGDTINAFEKLRDPSHGLCLSLAGWRRALKKAGFSVLAEETRFKELDFDYWAQRHDRQFQRYLLAMLSEIQGEAARFLRPQLNGDQRTFRLCEGIFIARVGEARS